MGSSKPSSFSLPDWQFLSIPSDAFPRHGNCGRQSAETTGQLQNGHSTKTWGESRPVFSKGSAVVHIHTYIRMPLFLLLALVSTCTQRINSFFASNATSHESYHGFWNECICKDLNETKTTLTQILTELSHMSPPIYSCLSLKNTLP